MNEDEKGLGRGSEGEVQAGFELPVTNAELSGEIEFDVEPADEDRRGEYHPTFELYKQELPRWLEILRDEPIGGSWADGYPPELRRHLGLPQGFAGSQIEAWDILRLMAKKELVIDPLPESFWTFEEKVYELRVEFLRWLQKKGYDWTQDRINREIARQMKKISQSELKELGTCKVDLRFGGKHQTWEHAEVASLRLGENPPVNVLRDKVLGEGESMFLHPGHLVNAMTLEHIKLPNFLEGTMDGRSRHARVGLRVMTAAGFAAGFEGFAVMELKNEGPYPLEIRYGDRICAMGFELMSSPTERGYQGQFHGQTKPQVS